MKSRQARALSGENIAEQGMKSGVICLITPLPEKRSPSTGLIRT